MDTTFAALLKHHRLAVGLTQEVLAERAGVGVRSIQGLERAENRPARDTLRRLADALALADGERVAFLAAGTPTPRRSPPRGLAPAAPPQPPAPRHNLPRALTPLIGRAAAQAEVLALLTQAPLVTLTGSGGVGKTRLALAVAGAVVDQYPDGVWLVELAALAEPSLVPAAVAQVLGVREEPDRPLSVTLAGAVQERTLLLVLDNCEQLVGACAALAGVLLRACPRLRILATSQAGLEVAGEQRYRVPSLPIPDLAHLPPLERLADEAAVALFMARARERRPDFALTAQNAAAVSAVCARLDGIPLALELAAARVGILSVEGIASRLDDRFQLLTGGSRDALPRHRTLRATLAWSYELLGATEQLLLDRLSVFAGGCTLAVATAVCAGEGIDDWQVLDLLDLLATKSLVHPEEASGEVRYALLETVRQYGQERLKAAGGSAAARDRHLSWYLALAEEAEPHLESREQLAWLERLEAEHDNLRAALRWARERGAVEEALRLTGALGRFWQVRGYFGEGRGWLEGALAAGSDGSAAARAKVLREAGDLLRWQGHFGEAVTRFEQSLVLYRAHGDTLGVASALHYLVVAEEWRGDFARATQLLEESLALRRELGDRVGTARSLNQLAWMAYLQGEYERAVALYEESLALCRAVGTAAGSAIALSRLACVLERQGDYVRAVALQEEALPLWLEVGNRMGITWSLVNLGWALLAQGEDERATAHLEESLARSQEEGHFWGVPYALTCLGWVAFRRGEHTVAAARQDEALARYRQVGFRWGIARVSAALGCVLQARSAYGQAAACLNESLRISHTIGARGLLGEALEGTAWAVAASGRAQCAARLAGAAAGLRESLGAALHPVLRAGHEQAMRSVRDALGEAALASAWAEGHVLPLEEAVAVALEATAPVHQEQ